ncbi:MAG TPA: aminotransferase class V-fold PLP-dependent enzyme [Candidatus Thermoplasmatota archaeon]|nr:aminotransferase class V-fold PLP-dependent enzyme [Candidatus Thermoplasmatota archaeon]
MGYDARRVRADFPILRRRIRTLDGSDRPLVYLDHGASTHAPRQVIAAVTQLLESQYANIHRGNHTLSRESSELFDDALATFQRFVRAEADTTVTVLGQNTTMALDLAAHVMEGTPGATLVTLLEHHSNDLPHRARGPVLHADVDGEARLVLEDIEAKLQENHVKLLAVTGASNVAGTLPPLGKLARLAHDAGARILVDAAQLYAHAPIDRKPEGHPEHLDFLAAAGHKAYAPLGSAFLMGPKDVMDQATPYIPGGGTVEWVTPESALFVKGPDRHMGGTPNVAGAVAFATATRYLEGIGMEAIRDHEVELIRHALARFGELEESRGLTLYGPRRATEKAGVFTFSVPEVRHELVSSILNHEHAIATRNGCFCAHPLLHRLLDLRDTSAWTNALGRGDHVDLPGATRASLGIYNTAEEIDLLAEGLETIARGAWKGRYDMHEGQCVPRESPLVTA